jgi:hypothetical protein
VTENLTEEQRAATPCHVALCPDCKLIVACAVQRPEFKRDNAKLVASWVRDDLTVSTMRVDEVRKATWGHAEGCSLKTQKQEATEPAGGNA